MLVKSFAVGGLCLLCCEVLLCMCSQSRDDFDGAGTDFFYILIVSCLIEFLCNGKYTILCVSIFVKAHVLFFPT